MAPAKKQMNDVTTFYKSEFNKYEKYTSENLTLHRLTNDIHPLFDSPLRQAVPDFKVVEQAARLASRFIACGALDGVYHSLLNDGKPGRSWQKRNERSKVGLEIPLKQTEQLTESEREDVRELLQYLSKNITFSLDHELENDGMTDCLSDTNPRYENGEKSKIRIPTRMYNDLQKAQSARFQDVPWILNLQVTLAVTLVHEIGHAIENLVHGKHKYALFLGDSLIHENGLEVENCLFGGHLSILYPDCEPHYDYYRYFYDSRQSKQNSILVLREYPYQGLVGAYCPKGRKGVARRGEPKDLRPLDIAWRVPLTFLAQFFDDDFWETQVSGDLKALRPNCSLGYCFAVDERGNSSPVQRHPKGARQYLYVPSGYRRLRDGTIKRRSRKGKGQHAGYVDTTRFWDRISQRYASGEVARPWINPAPDEADVFRLNKHYRPGYDPDDASDGGSSAGYYGDSSSSVTSDADEGNNVEREIYDELDVSMQDGTDDEDQRSDTSAGPSLMSIDD